MRYEFWLALVVIVSGALPARSQPALPLADEVEWPGLAAHCARLLEALQEQKAPLPAATERSLRLLLKEDANDPDALATRVQKLLDAHCLVGVTINPESRVKAVRGPAAADLARDRATVVLVKVVNQAGITKALALTGPQLRPAQESGTAAWLEARPCATSSLGKTLSGNRVEYILVRLTPHESGKREATFKFDVGQGTQDLGFRAEVPILFTIK